ncbi:MAG: peroxiredoxin [Bacteroidales bacterium]|nr:peroxiredoxin [Bacteroidales bacterium]
MFRLSSRCVAAGLAFTLFLGSSVSAADDKLKVKVGDAFPNVALKAAQIDKLSGKKAGDTVNIADLKGKTVVVFFYPRALTRGCTVESCGFRDLADKFPKNVILLGASNDGEQLQQKFIDTHKLPYPLLCDTEFQLINALGISSGGKAAKRVTFIVGPDGKIAKIYEKVSVATHPKEVLDQVSK